MGAQIELAISIRTCLGGGFTGPWPPTGYTLSQMPRAHVSLILLAGPLANFFQAAFSFALGAAIAKPYVTAFLFLLGTFGIAAGAPNLTPTSINSDGGQLWQHHFGRLSKTTRAFAWLTAAVLTFAPLYLLLK